MNLVEPLPFRPGSQTARVARRVGILAGALSLVFAGNSSAATTQIGRAGGNTSCATGINSVQATTASGTPSYSVPAGDGLIISWSTQGGPATGSAQLQVWRPTPTPDSYTLVGASPDATVTPNTLNTFSLAAPIPVQAGDLLGLRTVSGGVACALRTGDEGDLFRGQRGPAPTAGSTQALDASLTGYTLNVAVTVQQPDPTPTSPAECKNGGWEQLTDDQGRQFKNQGDCVSFVASQGRNTAGG